jgi:hypothetical protein
MVLDMALGKVRTTLSGAIEAASSIAKKKIAAIAGFLQRRAPTEGARGHSRGAYGGAREPGSDRKLRARRLTKRMRA